MYPVYIEGRYGVLHRGGGSHGVVICGTLGDESLNVYRAQVFLAERLAQAGYTALRISYHGCGDSAGADGEPDRFRAWIDTILVAVRWMRSQPGLTTISLCGMRIGAALAARAAVELDDLDGLIMLAPVTSGRRFLREQTLAARTLAEIWHSANSRDEHLWFEAHRFRSDIATRNALDALDVGKLRGLPVRRVLLLDQPGVPANNRLVAVLRADTIDVTHETASDCDGLLLESHEATVPHVAFTRIVAWLGNPVPARPPSYHPCAAQLDLGDFNEEAVTLGPNDALFGILASPKQRQAATPVVLIVGTGANPRFGTSRGAVDLARWLAEHGVASLRMDGHGIGDSAPETGEHGMPYSKQGDRDVCSGVDFLATRFDAAIIVFGMCSGAYHAFQAAVLDQRIKGVMLVNLQKFVWHDGESLSVVQRTTLRTTGFYLRNLASVTTWRRLLRGQIEAGRIARALADRAVRQVAAAADPAIAAVSGETQVGMVRRQLAELSQRSVPVLYALSGNDPGLDEIAEYFGIRGWRLRRNPHVMFYTLPGADHTLSAHWARQRLQQVIAHYLRERFHIAVPTAAPESDVLVGSRSRSIWRATTRPKQSAPIDSAPTAA